MEFDIFLFFKFVANLDDVGIDFNGSQTRQSHELLKDEYLNKLNDLEYENLLKHIGIS